MHRLLRTLGNYIEPGKMSRFLNPNIYPDNTWYRKHLERNYDVVFLGDADVIPKLTIPDGLKAFDLSLAGQNLEWDYNVIRQFFSILKPNGCVVFPLSGGFVDDLCNKVDERKYYMCLRPYFFSQSQLKMMYIRICKHIPILAWRPMNFNRLLHLGRGGSFGKAYEKADRLLSQICKFLEERDLRTCFFLVANQNSEHYEQIASLFEGKNCKLILLPNYGDYKWESVKNVLTC